MGGSWLAPDFNLTAFKLFAGVAGSAEWLALEHPILTLLSAGVCVVLLNRSLGADHG